MIVRFFTSLDRLTTKFHLFSTVASPRSPSRPGGSSKLEKSKLEKILGAEYADKVAADVAADLQPWYLRTAYNSQEILVDNDGSIRGGTVAALVERLTAHEQAGEVIAAIVVTCAHAERQIDHLSMRSS